MTKAPSTIRRTPRPIDSLPRSAPRGGVEITHDPDNPVTASTEPQVGEPRALPDRMCQRCEKAAEPDTAYGVAIAKSGIGHYTADDTLTLCGLDHSEWPVA